MNETDEIVLSIVENVLGSPRPTNKVQKYFNCRSKKCINDHNKFNLSFNPELKIFKCWKCGIKGNVYSLIKKFGDKNDIKKLELILPYYKFTLSQGNYSFEKEEIYDYRNYQCQLPDDYRPLWEDHKTFKYQKAFEYVNKIRKISQQEIAKYRIGYTEEGDRKLRIIVPSFNKDNKINYYEARAYWDKLKQPYVKPDFPDSNYIIFNEKFINWDLPIYLVEGVFDSLRIPNSIPMLGKIPSNLIVSKLMENQSKVILCLDEDAIKDSYELYNDLSSLGLDVYFIDMENKDDVSKIYEEEGKEGIKNLLQKKQKIDIDFYMQKIMKYAKE